MRSLLLIRHAESAPVEGVPPDRWGLTERGRRSCAELAERLRSHELEQLVASHEPTAVQRVLGHAPVRDRSVVDGDLVALEGLVQTVLFYDHVFFLDDYKERHRP